MNKDNEPFGITKASILFLIKHSKRVDLRELKQKLGISDSDNEDTRSLEWRVSQIVAELFNQGFIRMQIIRGRKFYFYTN